MEISEDLRKRVVEELIYCADRISKERNVRKKTYFYGGAGEIIDSVLSLNYDPQLVFIEFVLEISYTTINSRIETLLEEKDTTVEFIDGFFDRLAENLMELAKKIEADEDTYNVLEKIIALTYTTTEIGFYLYAKGTAKL